MRSITIDHQFRLVFALFALVLAFGGCSYETSHKSPQDELVDISKQLSESTYLEAWVVQARPLDELELPTTAFEIPSGEFNLLRKVIGTSLDGSKQADCSIECDIKFVIQVGRGSCRICLDIRDGEVYGQIRGRKDDIEFKCKNPNAVIEALSQLATKLRSLN